MLGLKLWSSIIQANLHNELFLRLNQLTCLLSQLWPTLLCHGMRAEKCFFLEICCFTQTLKSRHSMRHTRICSYMFAFPSICSTPLICYDCICSSVCGCVWISTGAHTNAHIFHHDSCVWDTFLHVLKIAAVTNLNSHNQALHKAPKPLEHTLKSFKGHARI